MTAERRSLDTRNKILEVAEKEFALCGFSGAHLQGMAEQVGVQKTALYYYFPSKAALYTAVLARMVETLDETVIRAVGEGGSPSERLERLVGDLNDLLAERRYYSKILFRLFVDRAPLEFAAIQTQVERVIGRLLTFYREGVERGDFRKLSARHFFMSLIGVHFFHYATSNFAAAILGVEDIFTHNAVSWRRSEVQKLLAHGILEDETEISLGDDPGDD